MGAFRDAHAFERFPPHFDDCGLGAGMMVCTDVPAAVGVIPNVPQQAGRDLMIPRVGPPSLALGGMMFIRSRSMTYLVLKRAVLEQRASL